MRHKLVGFTKAEHNLLRSALHPDSRHSLSEAKLAEAFRLFNEAEAELVKESRLPSVDELAANRASQRAKNSDRARRAAATRKARKEAATT